MALDTIADRYAEAYFAQAHDDRRLPEALAEMQVLRQAMLHTPRLEAFLANPEIDTAEKRALLARAFGQLSAQTLNLVALLIANGRSHYLAAVAEAFEARWLASQGVQRVTIQSARPLSSSVVTQIRQRVEQLLQARLEVQATVEPQLLGGVRILVGDRELDGSLRRRLHDLRQQWLHPSGTGSLSLS